jgi:hypothetical protein
MAAGRAWDYFGEVRILPLNLLHAMGIETILFVFALILIAGIWGMARRGRRQGSDHDSSPPKMSER